MATSPASPKKTGRPSKYSPEVTDEICTRLALGESLVSICKTEGMPSQAVVYQWLLRHPEFQEKYTRAREEQAETHADEIVAIADETPATQPVFDKDGEVIDIKLDAGYIAWQKQRIEARKWTAAKLKPKKYGDKLALGGDADAPPIKTEVNYQIFDDILNHLMLKRQTEAAESRKKN
jgi:hypothetical protein